MGYKYDLENSKYPPDGSFIHRSKRKSETVEELRQEINRRLALDSIPEEGKKALAGILEDVLMATGNYHGFSSLRWRNGGGYEQWVTDGEPGFPEKQQYIAKEGEEYDRIYH